MAAALLGRGQDALTANILFQLRLPRAVMAVLLGAALSVAGYLLQTFFANPIAGPFVMGISSGAKLAVALTMVIFLNRGLLTTSLTLILAAFAGAMAAMLFVLAVARRVQRMSILVICGVMIGYICSAITDIVVAFAQDSNIVNLHNWSMGSFSGMMWGNAATAAVIVLPCLAAAFALSKPMAAYQMGESYAASVGVPVRAFSVALVLLSSLLAACVTAFAGPDLVCRHRGAASGKTYAGQCKTAARAAWLRSGRRGVLPAVRPDRPQPVCTHRAVDQLGHGGVRCAGGHLAVGAPPAGGGTAMSYCETHALAVGYSAPLLQDIALQAERGKILVLIGPNGAGKSTVLKTLAGQLAPQGGAVLLDGQSLTDYTPAARARKLALMLPHTPRTELTTCFEVAAAGRYPYTGRLGILLRGG